MCLFGGSYQVTPRAYSPKLPSLHAALSAPSSHPARCQLPSAMFFTAAVPRSLSRRVLSHGSRSLVGRKHSTAVASRGFSSAFKPTPGARKSAAVESLDDWDSELPPASKTNPACIVNSHTEWDPLEEVIVGRVDDATIPEWHVSGKAVWPAKHWDMYKNHVGESFPNGLVQKGA